MQSTLGLPGPHRRGMHKRHMTCHSLHAGHSSLGIHKCPLWASRDALMPLTSGVLNIHEPRFLSMFDTLQRQQLEYPGTPIRFGHIMSPSAAPPALIHDCGRQGWPKVGVIANVKELRRRDDGTLQVQYELSRRFQILNLLQEEPYPVAYVTDYNDEGDSLSSADKQATDELEQEVYRSLLQIERLSGKLHGSTEEQHGSTEGQPLRLPQSIARFAPPPPPEHQESFAQVLSDAGYLAGFDIATWQRQGARSGGGSRRGGAARGGDPYSHVTETLAKDARQELFSFAAASVIEGMGNVECLALLNSRDTAARLYWVAQAIGPYHQELQAKVSVMKALT